MIQNLIQNVQCFLASTAFILTAYQFSVLFNNWFYPYFLEKINLRPTDNFDKTDFAANLKMFFLLIVTSCLVYFAPLMWSTAVLLTSLVMYQLFKINELTLVLKKLYGLS
jgi:hypothetical protein